MRRTVREIVAHVQVDKHLDYINNSIGFKDPAEYQVVSKGFQKTDQGETTFPVGALQAFYPFDSKRGLEPGSAVEVGGAPPNEQFCFIQTLDNTPVESFYQVNYSLAVPLPKWVLAHMQYPSTISINIVVLAQASYPATPKSVGEDIVLSTDLSGFMNKVVLTALGTTTIVRNNAQYWRYVLMAYGLLARNYKDKPWIKVEVAFRKKYAGGAVGYYGTEEFHLSYDLAVYASGEALRPLLGLPCTPDTTEGGGRKTPIQKTLSSRRRSV